MGSSPAPFSDIGRRARDLLIKDFNYDQKILLSIPSSSGLGITASGVKRDDVFVGDISTQHKSGNTTVDLKVDTYSNVSTKVTLNDVFSSTKVAFGFSIPDHKSGKLEVHYAHPHAVINSSIGLNPSPLLDVAAAIGTKDIAIGGTVGFDTATSSFTKYDAGISLNKPDFSAAVILTDKGQTLKASYVHTINPFNGNEVGVEMIHRFSTYENSFSIGSSHRIDPLTAVKAKFFDNGKVAMLCQREWRPKSFVTVSAEYDSKSTKASPKLGLALALKP
ncbi:OLC1v1035183C1 [Oldenlandia corymbosa var. corymbosa]|uniref:Voltage-dependent anion-selective channel protein n=1 Tax=Oldenlandia corymbosa var. corymbosa TaxID=529605 RepID=A0AAV1CVF5_OLDCO|nr:OLC1v1035183C1 [Oldenlandia corymbosa var. corymbosa]